MFETIICLSLVTIGWIVCYMQMNHRIYKKGVSNGFDMGYKTGGQIMQEMIIEEMKNEKTNSTSNTAV